jgi:phage shock protein E
MPEWFQKVFRVVATALAAVGSIACGSTSGLRALPDGALIVDVRTAAEFGGEHFPGAINIPVGDLGRRFNELGEKDRAIVVYCRSGHRSAAAKRELDRRGFTNVFDGGALGTLMKLAPKGQQ